MTQQAGGFGYIAGGNIRPSRFVDLTASHTVSEADSGDEPIGISGKATRNAPYSSLDDGFCAIAGESSFRLHFEGEVCGLELGAGGCAAGDYLKPDADGKGVVAGTDADEYGAIALEAGIEGEVVEVIVRIGERAATS